MFSLGEMMMKRIAAATALAFATMLTPLSAAPKPTDVGTQLPVTSAPNSPNAFTGTLNLTRFVNNNGTVTAIGTLTGTVTSRATGEATSVMQNVALPVVATQGAAATPSAFAITAAAATCPILNLDLGPLHLDLLGLVVDLNRVVLTIVAQSGAGNLLGNLLCAVTGLLDNPSGLATLLNQILAAL
jgi:hypothetical protein